MVEVRLSKEAESDLNEAYQWYRKRSEIAAEKFTAAFREAILRVASNPETYPKCGKALRFILLRPYPYQLIYSVTDDGSCLVIVLTHTSRRPNWWRKRMK